MTTNTNAALDEYANPLNWDADANGVRRIWREPGSDTPDAYNGFEMARAALTTAAAVPPEGFVMVPVELAERVQESLGEFLMDHGWSQRDMDTSDDFGAVLLAADPKAEPVPAGEYPPLPGASLWRDETGIRGYGTDPGTGPWYTADQLRAYADTTCAMRAQAAPAVADKQLSDALDSLAFYRRRCELLQSWQSKMRDPERTIICDILANGQILRGPDGQPDACRYALAEPATVAVPSAPTLERLREWEKNGELMERVWGTLVEQENEIKRLTAAPTTQAAPQPAVQQGDDLQTFAIGDSNYAAGMLLGWNLCTAGMDAEFSRIREDRMRAAVQASRAAHPAAPVAQGDAEDAARYRFLAGHCRSTSEHWGGRWSIIVDGPAPKSHDSEDDFDEAVDAARKQGGA